MSDPPDWSPGQRARLEALPRAAEPSPDFERRVVDALARQALLRSPRAPRAAWPAIAASLAMFICGVVAGRASIPSARPAPVAEGRSFVLLLLAGVTDPSDGAAEPRRVAEYAAWARSLRGEGRLVSGEKLADPERLVRGAGSTSRQISGEPIVGYFVVRARDFDEAERIARSCPHLKHGGAIVVREIEKT